MDTKLFLKDSEPTTEELKSENEALRKELHCCSDRCQKATIEYEELQKKYAEMEKEIAFMKGQISAFQFCASY